MYDVRIPERLYEKATQAAQANHVSLEEFVAEAVQLHLQADPGNHDHLFTPEIIAELDAAAAEVRTGKGLTGEQVDKHLAENKAKWLANHPS